MSQATGTVDASGSTMIDAPGTKPIDGKVFMDACIDSDHDGVCDSVEWPCAPTLPMPVKTQVTMTAHPDPMNDNQPMTTFIIDNATVNGATRLVATHGDAAQIALHYDISDTACPAGCIDQIEIGWVAGQRSGCLFDQAVSKSSGAAGNVSTDTIVSFPNTPGAYDLRLNIGQNLSCDNPNPMVTQQGWWKQNPDDTHTIARVCVQ